MSRIKSLRSNGLDYGEFYSPLTGLITMVFVQTRDDLVRLGNRTRIVDDGLVVSKREIKKFLLSDWAVDLGNVVGVEPNDLVRYAREVTT